MLTAKKHMQNSTGKIIFFKDQYLILLYSVAIRASKRAKLSKRWRILQAAFLFERRSVRRNISKKLGIFFTGLRKSVFFENDSFLRNQGDMVITSCIYNNDKSGVENELQNGLYDGHEYSLLKVEIVKSNLIFS